MSRKTTKKESGHKWVNIQNTTIFNTRKTNGPRRPDTRNDLFIFKNYNGYYAETTSF